MSTVPYWVDPDGAAVASLWDFLWLGGVLIPGLWNVEITKSRSIDVAKVKGQDAATLTDNGYDLATVKMSGRMWLPDHLNDFKTVLLQFDPVRHGSVKYPLDIYHPVAELQGVKSIYIKSITLGNPSGGIWTPGIEAVEWAQETTTTKTGTSPKGFSAAGKKQSTDPATDDDYSVTKPSTKAKKNL
jgi:hypothetical protein